MTFISFRTSTAPRLRWLLLHAAVQIGSALIFNPMCFGQTPNGDEKPPGSASGTVPGSAADKAPLTADERVELATLE